MTFIVCIRFILKQIIDISEGYVYVCVKRVMKTDKLKEVLGMFTSLGDWHDSMHVKWGHIHFRCEVGKSTEIQIYYVNL